jgi:hypothetical protein
MEYYKAINCTNCNSTLILKRKVLFNETMDFNIQGSNSICQIEVLCRITSLSNQPRIKFN